MSTQPDNLLPIGYKRVNKVPLYVDVISKRSPLQDRALAVIEVNGERFEYVGLSPFISSVKVTSFSGIQVRLYRCLLRASSS